MNRETSVRNIVGFIVVFLIVGLGYASFLGKKQDEQFANEQMMYNLAMDHVKKGQYNFALPLLKQVEKKQMASFTMRYYTGLALEQTGYGKEAVLEFQNALDLNPYLVEDSIFMLEFAEALLNAKKNEEAKIVLKHCQTLPIPEQIPDYLDEVNGMLEQISTNS
jgi:predicted Zn-dependent protease